MPDKDLQSIQAARDLVEAAHRAQAVVATFDQARIDAICEALAQAAQRESMRLAQLAHDETGYGNAADKNVKNLFSAVNLGRVTTPRIWAPDEVHPGTQFDEHFYHSAQFRVARIQIPSAPLVIACDAIGTHKFRVRTYIQL